VVIFWWRWKSFRDPSPNTDDGRELIVFEDEETRRLKQLEVIG